MSKTGSQKLEIRISRILSDVRMVLGGLEVRNAPKISVSQAAHLAREYDIKGSTRKGARVGKRTFCDALRRHNARQVRAYTQNAHKHVRALRKLVESYVERAGIVEAS